MVWWKNHYKKDRQDLAIDPSLIDGKPTSEMKLLKFISKIWPRYPKQIGRLSNDLSYCGPIDWRRHVTAKEEEWREIAYLERRLILNQSVGFS